MSCICTYVDPGSVYPAIDPRRVAGELPQRYGYGFAQDGVGITVAEAASLGACQMLVELSVAPGLAAKDVMAWNYCVGGPVGSISGGGGIAGTTSMLVRRGQCFAGTHTLLLRKHFWHGMAAMYSFPSDELWRHWGGMRVTIDWTRDNAGSGLWGHQTPQPSYPIVRFPDGTLVRSVAQPGVVFVVFGGAKFRVDAANSVGFNLTTARLESATIVNALPSAPVDGTLLRDFTDPKVYIVFGGAKFWIPDPESLSDLGFTFADVRVVPPGTLANILTIPNRGTLLRAEDDPKVYLVTGSPAGNVLSWVTSPQVLDARCLYWSNVRLAPRGSLTALPKGADIV